MGNSRSEVLVVVAMCLAFVVAILAIVTTAFSDFKTGTESPGRRSRSSRVGTTMIVPDGVSVACQ